MIEKKERYIVTMATGEQINAVAGSFSECLLAFGEENVEKIEKLDYEEPKPDEPAFSAERSEA